MSALLRYRKSGGFKQLLFLVEASPANKREQLLAIVQKEDKRWFEELNKRMLTIDKVLAWNAEQVERVFSFFPEATWLKALLHLPAEARLQTLQRVAQFHPVHKQKQLEDLMNSLNPAAAEIDAAHIMIIKKIRELQLGGHFKPEQLDPNLAVHGLDRLVF